MGYRWFQSPRSFASDIGLPCMSRLSSRKPASSASISSSMVVHSSEFQTDAWGNGEGWMSSPTDQNFGGASFDISSRYQRNLVGASGRDVYQQQIEWRDCSDQGTGPISSLIVFRANTMSGGAGPSRVSLEGVMLFEQPFARVGQLHFFHSSAHVIVRS